MIQYDKQFNAKINSIVKAFNAKVARLESAGVKYLPEKVSVKDLKATYFERDDLKRKLRQLERFNTKGAEEIVKLAGGAKVTKWELDTLRQDMSYLKREYSKKIQDYGGIIPTSLGKVQAVSYARMGDPKYEGLKVLRNSLDRDITELDQSGFNRKKRSVFSQVKRWHRQKYILWANYFTFLEDVAYKAGVDEELLKSILKKLEDMDINKFVEFFETEKAFANIIDYYDIQKMKHGVYSQLDIDTIKTMFDAINTVADDYL